MSYLGLWDRFMDVRDFWAENRKLLDDFSSFLKDKAELDRYYGKGLERLGKLPLFEKVFGTVAPAFQGIKLYYTEGSQYFLNHAEYLQEDLYTKIKKIIITQDALIYDHKKHGKKLVMEREKLVKIHLKSRDKYWKACKDNETPTGKANVKSLQIEDNYHKAYLSSINNLNAFNAFFQEEVKKLLQIYQDQNLEKLKALQHYLQVFISGEASSIYSMKMHLDNVPSAIETFSPEKDQKMFVDSTNTGKVLENEIFIGYNQGYSEKDAIEIIDMYSDEEIKKVIDNCWAGNSLTPKEKIEFTEKIKTKNGKKKLITALNEKRKNGQFEVPRVSFEDLGELFRITLDHIDIVDHLNAIKQCIILSQTFYSLKLPSEEAKNQPNRIYLQSLIIDHPVWKKEDQWTYIVENAVETALESLNMFGDEIDVNEDLEIRKKSIISSTVISYGHIMQSFNVDKKKVAGILDQIKLNYNLTDEELPILYLMNLTN